MTKEELEKEATEYAQKLGVKDFIAKPKEIVAYFGYLAGAEPREKRIAELEKENAELKGLKDVATLIRANNDTVITLMQLNNMLVSKNQQLTKAKEIIKKFSEFANLEVEYDPEHPQEHTDLWNELCKEAEQFINSEVEE